MSQDSFYLALVYACIMSQTALNIKFTLRSIPIIIMLCLPLIASHLDIIEFRPTMKCYAHTDREGIIQ